MSARPVKLRHIDAALPLTAEQRRQVMVRASVLAARRRGLRLKLALMAIALLGGGIGGGVPLMWWLARMLPFDPVAAVAGYLLLASGCGLVFARTVWSWYAAPTRQAVRELGYEVCLSCGYWLRGLRDGVKQCPECGATREAMVRPGADNVSRDDHVVV